MIKWGFPQPDPFAESFMEDAAARIRGQVAKYPLLIYMKGTPDAPRCGFSARLVEILTEYERRFAYVDVLQNPDIRAALPEYAKWPTFPQLWINGELVGGCDIVGALHESGELRQKLEQVAEADEAG